MLVPLAPSLTTWSLCPRSVIHKSSTTCLYASIVIFKTLDFRFIYQDLGLTLSPLRFRTSILISSVIQDGFMTAPAALDT